MVRYEYDSYSRPIHWCEEWTEFADEHRDDLFHSRALIQERLCAILVDPTCMSNFVSTEVVDKFQLPVIEHPHPYELPWFTNGDTFKVTHRALIPFTFGKGCFSDEVLCDVVPMRINHLLLGKLWLYRWQASYCGVPRHISLRFNGKKLKLLSLTTRETFDDQRAKELRLAELARQVVQSDVTIEEKLHSEEMHCDIVDEVIQKDAEIVGVHDDYVTNNVDIDADIDELMHDDMVEDSPINFVGEAAQSAGSLEQLKELQATHIYSDPFVVHCSPFSFVIVDFCALSDKLYKRMMTEMFTSSCCMVGPSCVGLLTYVGPILVFDPGGFEDESFSTGRD